MKKILFIHQNFPAQFTHIAKALQARGDDVTVLTTAQAAGLDNVRVLRYQISKGNHPATHPWMVETETKFIRGEACYQAAKKLHANGYRPDLIYAHPGWGEALFLKDLWPATPMLSYFEFYYHAKGHDVDFDPEFPPASDIGAKLRMKNLSNLMNLEASDAGVAPTEWQRSTHPLNYRPKIRVIHDGIDTDHIRPNPEAEINIESQGIRLRPGDPVVTFVNRTFEPYRGYHIFMRALPAILEQCPSAQVILIGQAGTSYSARPEDGGSYAQRFLDEVKNDLDLSRVHFVGTVPHPTLTALMQVSAAHVYLTYPFVLSWSMLEAMSAGCLVIGSRTAPVEEFISHETNGLLVDFLDANQVATAVVSALRQPEDYRQLRTNARKTIIERCDLFQHCLPAQIAYIDELASRRD